ncbi:MULTISPECIES: NUDIX hydrolase [Sulfitobacter]|jgi:8-oxo-dGTP pyrophosphatase MutT (NUDIX family)|uniref:8-oxo-dGTP pyrophosphatase MutT, NUDIX family n=1 Tax=Sulfitobacter pontiacus TaxID=60137 RepID=A0A1H2XX61_9RHOB|nr:MULTISPECIES: NUDIX hydrolase [Sulfitobacter]MAJ79582.1 NUDIX domain-containing protein [Roseobacter sp.]HBM41918.1 NUDIX domain-containing protein [Sulfitobacter sp.]AXI50224.1 NUDIX domain-containing protein [Sulfitobacter sp. SK025]EAP79993.1 hydrolase, NUDIX family [Sulfitobacter sp. NAS-14.1]KAJ30952.1 NUDIX hydrolase [Sulfitobacter pontiacus 3SOLIMAR09]|tara:strand:- start:543 stop:1001 length:459 start_codon:yes stop_codon:yes gene_type:complete
MIHELKRAWEGMILPIWRRPKRIQVAALCYRETPEGKEVLMITSRDTGRWIVPKGWPIDGLDGAGAALREAWEEAGVSKADIESEPIGYYDYDKGLSEGMTTPVIAQVYLTRVRHIEDEYPEVDLRTRRWMPPKEAAELVAEPDLREILLNL